MSGKESVAVEKHILGVGDRLKEAREGKKYSQVEVAVQLRLSKDIIVALEAHDWNALHGRTYARGYFANYVRFLGLPFDEMMALFNLEYDGTPSDINLKHVGEQQAVRHKRGWVWLLLIVVVSTAAYYWFEMQPTNDVNESINESSEVDGQFDESVVEPLSQSYEPVIVEQTEPDNDPVVPNLSLGLEPETVEAEPVLVTELPAESIEADMTDEVYDEEVTLQVAQKTPSLTVSVSDACWVEITNQQSEVLVSRVLKPDESISLESVNPLNVLIGKAGVTTVIYDENTIDLAPYTEGDVARLTVGIES